MATTLGSPSPRHPTLLLALQLSLALPYTKPPFQPPFACATVPHTAAPLFRACGSLARALIVTHHHQR